MNSSSRIPPPLQPYVKLPREDSLLLLTSTLGASANWLLIRFLCDALSSNTQDGGPDEGHNVVLVSWMRDYEFWKQEARKGAGLDLERLKREKRFAFVDGLSGLVRGDAKEAQPQQPQAQPQAVPPQAVPRTIGATTGMQSQRGPQTLPARGPPGRIVPARGPPALSAQPARPAPNAITSSATTPQTSTNSQPTLGHYTLTSLDLAHLKTTVSTALSSLASTTPRKTLLILDTPDLPLALSSASPSSFISLLLFLHNTPPVSHILTHMHADTPLLTPSAPPQPLETAQYNFLTKVAHMSRRILGTRVLDTGVARDVSGVVRVTEQSVGWTDLGFGDEEQQTRGGDESGKGKEFLYQVKGDGSVRVFERGAGGEG
jgi:elongator complex protein 6